MGDSNSHIENEEESKSSLNSSISLDFSELFEKIELKELKTKHIELYSQINDSTKKLSLYLDDSIQKFPSLLDDNLKSFSESLTHLKKISVPNKCICAGIIETIPGWRCIDCNKYENSFYCNKCYLNSKDWHKDHKVIYLPTTVGMCDCGDPDALYKYCREHSGPFTKKEQIEDYIQKTFGIKVVDNLRKFFDDLFVEFSKYLILTEKCDLFMEDIFNEKFKGNLNKELLDEKLDIIYLKNNFCIVFQNLIYFLRLITKDNIGMLHLISEYLLKNNLESINLEDQFMVEHRCIEISQNNIKIYYNNNKKEKHFCKCPFLRHFLENYRDEVKLKTEGEEEAFIVSFANNLYLRFTFGVLNYFLYYQNLYNNNTNISYCKAQFYIENAVQLVAKETTLIEETVDILYQYSKKILKNIIKNRQSQFAENMINKFFMYLFSYGQENKLYSKEKVKNLMTNKTSYINRYIDLICEFHNNYEMASIIPHPSFSNTSVTDNLLEILKIFIKIPGYFNCFFDWKNIEKLKDIYKYIIYKILKKKKEGIKLLKDNEFSLFLLLYKIFGKFINSFCFNYSFLNNCSIIESISYFKKNFFESEEQVDDFVNIILKDYFKLFGFLSGTKNNFFNYYDKADSYFQMYFEQSFYQDDFTLLKYIFLLNKKNIDINSYLKDSNIENVYSKFNDIFNLGIINNKIKLEETKKEELKDINFDENLNERMDDLYRIEERKKNDEEQNEFNIIMQWYSLFELLICLLKDDSSIFWSLMTNYEELFSSKVKRDLFNNIKNNKYIIEDLKNILKEKIVQNIIAKGNLINKENLEKNIDKYLLILFNEKNIYNKILDELTHNKLSNDTKIFYLKDKYLKYLDCNYYINLEHKSAAQKYILDFKKDYVKTFNYYYYNHSELTFDFFKMVYEKIFLNKNNLDLIIKIVEKLINSETIMEYSDKKSIRNSLLPIILNYLLMFSVLNTKSFIEFKMANKKELNILHDLLFNFTKTSGNNNSIDKDLEDYIKEVLNKINQYQLIYDFYKGDLSKLNKNDNNTNISEQLSKNININDLDAKNVVDEKKEKSKKLKEKLKSLIKKKSNDILKNIESNEEIKKAIDEQFKDLENMENKDDEIMCFFCGKPIKLNSFKKPYGKLGLVGADLFYINSIKSTIREEFSKLKINDYNAIYIKIMKNISKKFFYRIIFSCGHYFHNSCFIGGSLTNDEDVFGCPLCLKHQNRLIPPLTLFHNKYSFLKSEKMDELFEQGKNIDEIEEIKKDISLFYETVTSFLYSINIFKNDIKSYSIFLDEMFPNYQAHLNSVENLFFIDGITFTKAQQIDNIKNLILSLRLLFNNSPDYNKNEIIDYIKETLLKLSNGPQEKNFIYENNDSYMYYYNIFEKIILSLQILFDYEEIKKSFKYIIYIFLPYFCFGIYFRKILIEKENDKLNTEHVKQKLNIDEFKKYLKDENKQIMDYLKSFLRKFCFIKIFSDYQNKNENLIIDFNDLSLEKILAIIDMEDLLKKFPKNEFSFIDIIYHLPSTFNSSDTFYKLFTSTLNLDTVLNKIFKNVIEYNNNDEDYEINQELFIQFNQIKLNFVHLEKNVFDFIENNAGKICKICRNTRNHPFICLICGDNVCNLSENNDSISHVKKCGDDFCIFIDCGNMKLYLIDRYGEKEKLFPIYVNNEGTGPDEDEITNEFNLSEEKLKIVIKKYFSGDYKFL